MQDVVANAVHAEEETLTAALLSFIDDKYFGEQDEITDKEFKAAQQKYLQDKQKKSWRQGKKIYRIVYFKQYYIVYVGQHIVYM